MKERLLNGWRHRYLREAATLTDGLLKHVETYLDDERADLHADFLHTDLERVRDLLKKLGA